MNCVNFGLDAADQTSRVLLREEALGDDVIEIDVEAQRRQEDRHHRPRMCERPGQRAVVAAEHGIEDAFDGARKSTRLVCGPMADDVGAHHGRRRQRDGQRNGNGDRQRHGEFAEQPSDDAAHEEDRDEHGDEGEAHRQHGEAHLARALQRRLHARHTRLEVASDVFKHDDRIVHHEPGGDGERHQRQCIEAVAEQVHDAERADERHRHGDARDQGGARIAQEEEHHHDDQHDRDRQRALDIVQRRADVGGAVGRDGDVDIARNRRLELRQQRHDAVDRVDDVGAGLAVENQQHRGLAVGEALIAQILDRIRDHGEVGEAHGRAVAVGDHERAVLFGIAGLVVGVELISLAAELDVAFGRVGVGGSERRAYVLEADAVFEEGVRVELDAHRRQRAAADRHLADALDLGQLLLHHGRGGIIELALAQRVRGERQDQHRRVGRVDLAVGGVAPEARWQIGARRVDRRLNVARGAVDVALEAELERDPRLADRARRGDLADVGDLAEMTLERCRHAGGDRLRARAGELRLHRDGRKIHLRQRRHRQEEECDRAGERHA
jgi:hypothetical protein